MEKQLKLIHMASFDLINAVGNAYQTTWDERKYLIRMAAIPILIKFIFSSLAMAYVEPENIIRMSLILMPAYFVEGWLLAHWARTVILGHRWPFKPTGDDGADNEALKMRGRGILGGTITFVLINVLMAGYFAFFMSYIPLDMDPEAADPKIAVIGMFMMVATILLFRFVWAYIPLAVNIPFRIYLKKLSKISTTFMMVGVWLVCFIPAIVLMQFLGGILSNAGGDENTLAAIDSLTILVRVVLDTIKNLLCTAGMAYAFIEIFKWKKPE